MPESLFTQTRYKVAGYLLLVLTLFTLVLMGIDVYASLHVKPFTGVALSDTTRSLVSFFQNSATLAVGLYFGTKMQEDANLMARGSNNVNNNQ